MCSQMRLRTASSRTCNCTLHSSCTHKLLLNLLMMDDALINNNLYFVFALCYRSFSLLHERECSTDAIKKIRTAKKMGKIVLMQSILFSDWKSKHWKSMWYVLKWCEARFFMHVDEFQNNFDRFILIVSNSTRLKYEIRSCACEIKSAINWKIIFAPQMQFNHNYFAFLTPQISLKSSIRLKSSLLTLTHSHAKYRAECANSCDEIMCFTLHTNKLLPASTNSPMQYRKSLRICELFPFSFRIRFCFTFLSIIIIIHIFIHSLMFSIMH